MILTEKIIKSETLRHWADVSPGALSRDIPELKQANNAGTIKTQLADVYCGVAAAIRARLCARLHL
jgi:hypothetical protein